jgi:hypothetical protein
MLHVLVIYNAKHMNERTVKLDCHHLGVKSCSCSVVHADITVYDAVN